MGVGGTISATGSPNFVTTIGRPVCFTRLSTARQRALNAEMAMVSLAIGQIYHGHVPWSISAGTQLLDPASHPALRLIGLAAAGRPDPGRWPGARRGARGRRGDGVDPGTATAWLLS